MAFNTTRPTLIKLVCPICFDLGYTQTSILAAPIYSESSSSAPSTLEGEELEKIPAAIEQHLPLSSPFVQCYPMVSKDGSRLLYIYTLLVDQNVVELDVVRVMQGQPTASEEALIPAFLKAQLLKNRRIPFSYWLKQSCPASRNGETEDPPCVIIRRQLHSYLLKIDPSYQANQGLLQSRGYIDLGTAPTTFYIGYLPDVGPPSAAEWPHVALDTIGWTIEGFLVDDIPHPFREPWSPNHGLFIGKRQLTCGDNGSEDAFQLATGWLHDCITSHPECSATEVCALPDRVIDVGLPEEPVPRLRLISGKGIKGRYACLSHRWDPETPKTTVENIDEHLRNIRWDSLSETFQDAITFLGKLSLWHNNYHGEPIRYIWIDSLCIIQNSESDWQEQSQKMCEVYSNALITFVESHCQGRDKRLFSKASKKRTATAIPVTDAEGRTREFYFRFPITHPDFHNGRNRVPIWTRGWVLQERLLSPRLLVFGSEELSWKCSGCNKCECGLDQVYMDHYNGMTTWRDPQVGRLSPINRKNMNLIIGKDPSESQLRMAWRLILESYSQLKLTYRKDTLAALAGLARSFDKQLGGRKYFTGFWYEERDASPPLRQTETMLDLIWRLEYSQDGRRDNRPDSPISQSWSWASPQCSIVYPFARDKLIKTYSGVADFRAAPTSAGFPKDSSQPGTFSNDMYTDTTPTMLVMAGPLFRTQLREEKYFLELAKTEDQEYVYFLGEISDLTQHSDAMGKPIETKLSLVEPPWCCNWGSDKGSFAKTPPIVFYPDNERATVSGAIYCLPVATFLHVAMKGGLRERRIFVALVLEQVGRLEAAGILNRDPTTLDTGSLIFRRLGLAYNMDRSWNDELDIWDRSQLSAVRII